MSSKRLDDDALGALRAWTPAQQAALNRQRITKNSKKDVDEDEREEYLKKRGRWTDPSIGLKAHEIKAEELINDFIKTHSPQLDLFLRCFARPHRALPGFVLLHLAFWWSAPWYLQFLLPFPLIYFIPVWCSLSSLFNASREDRQLWQAYWVILAVMGYIEFLVFGSTLPLFWWPKYGRERIIQSVRKVQRLKGEKASLHELGGHH
ncbi:hypothetical protein TREMEDRAFT_65897 [Tremella mesenterica DSM 1558]|uniref:uncharacterized protein n=1 Tax=Tremella mesenterica (strain ATCC 24925 / CBS 8224 / DSM 1558 / NBRC 9311 / NRRL Y-6157 / RJB 2259-6 / UBC 559-6) TaxID=578456 RepID=UPI00032CF130|nr:uncharacterized protein TREMEDRAFT_65897 [Tremella mesenterica DSM 1558]EIW66053.1 hypothetical protein TREMEDRAFT_65897 [Tremella mesenterica DSM 1558]